MRFTEIWSSVLNQNVTLRIAVVALSAAALTLAASMARLALREPIVIECGELACQAKIPRPESATHSTAEIEAFARYALPLRFDSAADSGLSKSVLSASEASFRGEEQQALETKGVRQRILVNGVTVSGTTVTVDTDRLLSIGSARSAVVFPLVLELSKTARTSSNPYGLVLSRVSAPKNPKQTKEEK